MTIDCESVIENKSKVTRSLATGVAGITKKKNKSGSNNLKESKVKGKIES